MPSTVIGKIFTGTYLALGSLKKDMKTTLTGNFREPYVRGPHVRYFLISIMISLVVAMMSVIGLLSIVRMLTS